jgi:hypothetical protein
MTDTGQKQGKLLCIEIDRLKVKSLASQPASKQMHFQLKSVRSTHETQKCKHKQIDVIVRMARNCGALHFVIRKSNTSVAVQCSDFLAVA